MDDQKNHQGSNNEEGKRKLFRLFQEQTNADLHYIIIKNTFEKKQNKIIMMVIGWSVLIVRKFKSKFRKTVKCSVVRARVCVYFHHFLFFIFSFLFNSRFTLKFLFTFQQQVCTRFFPIGTTKQQQQQLLKLLKHGNDK